MPRKVEELGALEVSRLHDPGLHFVGVVPGLALRVTPEGARSWILRVSVGGRRRDMGLGGYPEVPLATARQRGRDARDKVRSGIDPVQERRDARSALKASQAAAITFRRAAEAYIAIHGPGWKNIKHTRQWGSTLRTYAFPKIGDLLVRDIEKAHVVDVLQPIWSTKHETASRLRGRIELILSYAMQAGYRPEGLNPARWRGGLDKLLLARDKASKKRHFAALPFRDVPQFMTALRACPGTSARAVEFVILTAARSGEVRGAKWQEIDFVTRMWTIPAERMKAGKEHRVPLAAAAVALLEGLPRDATTDTIFVSPRGGVLSDMSLTAVLRRMKRGDLTVHGFRSSFRDWCSEVTNHAREAAEMALAHSLASKVEQAYRRGDLLEKRRQLMEDWASFCGSAAKVVEGTP
jgi:integrase